MSWLSHASVPDETVGVRGADEFSTRAWACRTSWSRSRFSRASTRQGHAGRRPCGGRPPPLLPSTSPQPEPTVPTSTPTRLPTRHRALPFDRTPNAIDAGFGDVDTAEKPVLARSDTGEGGIDLFRHAQCLVRGWDTETSENTIKYKPRCSDVVKRHRNTGVEQRSSNEPG